MSVAKDLPPATNIIFPSGDIESDQPIEDIIFPPGDIFSDEPPLESDLHLRQIILLLQCLELWWQNRNDFYAAGNLTIYYSDNQLKSEKFRGPDFFVVRGCERKPRKSWVVWHEDGKYPNIIIEILSSSTKATDKGLKKQIYQDTFRTPEYFLFDPYNSEFVGFQLVHAQYQPIEPNAQGWLWSQELELYLGVQDNQLRYFTAQGELLPTPEELVQQEKQRAERLAAKLRELNIDPDML
ncbi:MAG: Uma2 family endonuclease [Sphaerospermopsis sp.]|nr:Uma2 family endonuclease [Sphaerospermopsis sp.]